MAPAGDRDQVWNFYPAHTAPTALDIVWCRFPFVEDPENPAPKPRPCLVRSSRRNKKGHFFVEVAFGTSNTRSYSNADLFVGNLADMNEMGLPQATVFQLGRTKVLPWADEWFPVREDCQTPIVGHLNARLEEYLRLLIRQRGR